MWATRVFSTNICRGSIAFRSTLPVPLFACNRFFQTAPVALLYTKDAMGLPSFQGAQVSFSVFSVYSRSEVHFLNTSKIFSVSIPSTHNYFFDGLSKVSKIFFKSSF